MGGLIPGRNVNTGSLTLSLRSNGLLSCRATGKEAEEAQQGHLYHAVTPRHTWSLSFSP